MNVDIVLGASAWDDADRTAAREWVTDWYTSRGYRVATGVCQDKPWRKALAFNDAILASTAPVVIAADSDSFVTEGALERAIDLALAGAWVVPFKKVERLDSAATSDLLAFDPALVTEPLKVSLAQVAHDALAGGGIVVAARELWHEVGGFDPRFKDWGGEDYALGCAMRTLTGRDAKFLPGTLWHLWHTPAVDVSASSVATDRLGWRYRKAKYRPADMRALIGEWRR